MGSSPANAPRCGLGVPTLLGQTPQRAVGAALVCRWRAGELPDLKAGVCVQVLRVEGYVCREWGWAEGACVPGDMAVAPELTRTLCYACTIPHLALQCAEDGGRPEGGPLAPGAYPGSVGGEGEGGVVPLVADALYVFFSPQQLQVRPSDEETSMPSLYRTVLETDCLVCCLVCLVCKSHRNRSKVSSLRLPLWLQDLLVQERAATVALLP